MDIVQHNRDWLAAQSEDGLETWLELALRKHAADGDPFAFSPLNETIAMAETVAAGLSIATATFDAAFAVRIRRATERIVRRWPADDCGSWAILVELAWRLQASGAVEALEARASSAFLDNLFQDDARFLSDVLAFARQTLPYGPSAGVRFIYRLVEHRLFRDADARPTLESLCERDPGNLVTHLAVLREQLHSQAKRIERTKGFAARDRFHREMAAAVLKGVGFENFKSSIPRWFIVPSATGEHPTDNWLLEKIAFAMKVKVTMDKLWVAPLERPSNYQAVENVQLPVPQPAAGDLADPDFTLGRSRVPEPQD